MPVHYAYGTQKFVAFWGSLVSAVRYIKNKKYELKLVIIFSILCMIGTYLGSKLILCIDDIYLRYLLIFLIAIYFAFSIIKKYLKPKQQKFQKVKAKIKTEEPLSSRKRLGLSIIIGIIIGLYGGTIGVGLTSILILIFIKIFNIDSIKASGNARIITCALNLVAMITFILEKKIIFTIAIPATISSMLGNYVGAGLAMKKSNKIMGPLLKIIFVILFIELVIETVF